ncbi:hypothetical protein Ajs_0812 [Acidovorax sp. JS42]|nr:hypothetical protein Ajs_0812 [Acidovorax sp. JS42]
MYERDGRLLHVSLEDVPQPELYQFWTALRDRSAVDDEPITTPATQSAMRVLSKSKLLAFRQCPKRLWLEIHQPERRKDSGAAWPATPRATRWGTLHGGCTTRSSRVS